jgi:hypothetical protein
MIPAMAKDSGIEWTHHTFNCELHRHSFNVWAGLSEFSARGLDPSGLILIRKAETPSAA